MEPIHQQSDRYNRRPFSKQRSLPGNHNIFRKLQIQVRDTKYLSGLVPNHENLKITIIFCQKI